VDSIGTFYLIALIKRMRRVILGFELMFSEITQETREMNLLSINTFYTLKKQIHHLDIQEKIITSCSPNLYVLRLTLQRR
jgi:hypothetical protein